MPKWAHTCVHPKSHSGIPLCLGAGSRTNPIMNRRRSQSNFNPAISSNRLLICLLAMNRTQSVSDHYVRMLAGNGANFPGPTKPRAGGLAGGQAIGFYHGLLHKVKWS